MSSQEVVKYVQEVGPEEYNQSESSLSPPLCLMRERGS